MTIRRFILGVLKRHFLTLIMVSAVTTALDKVESKSLPTSHTEWSESVFKNTYKLIAEDDELQVLDTLPRHALPAFLARFWKRRDPTPTTEDNEYKSQIEVRVEWALTWYRTVDTRSPWDERGDVYIRFGPPDETLDRLHGWYAPADTLRATALGGAASKRGKTFESSGMVRFLRNDFKNEYGEVWYYYSRNMTLQFQGYNMEYRLVPFVESSGEYQGLPAYADNRNEIDSTTAVYRIPSGTSFKNLSMDSYAFRRDDGLYDLYIASAIPLREVNQPDSRESGMLEFRARAIVFDSSLIEVWLDSVYVHQPYTGRPLGRLAQQYWHTKLSPGLYVLAVEITNGSNAMRAVESIDKWLVPFADTTALDLSPLIIAASIELSQESLGSGIFRNDRRITPMPNRVFNEGHDIHFYHEIYNITLSDQSDSGVYHLELALYRNGSDVREVLMSRDIITGTRNTYQAGHLPANLVSHGDYILEIRTTDLTTGATKTALTNFSVRN